MQISVMATINTDAMTAKRKVTAWLVSEIANLLVGGMPQLVIGQQSVWRVPVLLTSSQVGQVGAVDVDTVSGQLFINSDLKKQLIANAKRAARSVSTAVG
jgi:hypothetical protein